MFRFLTHKAWEHLATDPVFWLLVVCGTAAAVNWWPHTHEFTPILGGR